MAGIFPASSDGGIAPNPADPANPIRAYPPANAPADTAALFYSNGCDVRLRPEVLNSLISEVEAVVDEAGLHYLSSSQQNMEVAIRYLIQRGIPHAGRMQGGPFDFTMTLDPQPAALNDYMLVVVTPEQDNEGASRLNTNGLGYADIVRRDGSPVGRRDLIADRPAVMLYFNGQWHILLAAGGQGAIIGIGAVDGWVRTDGSDVTGDGTANTPDKAFRTINGALAKLTGMYAPSADFLLNIRLGIPGTYEAAKIDRIPCQVTINGDPLNVAGYIIAGTTGDQNTAWSIYIRSCLSVTIIGVTLLIDQPAPNLHYALSNHWSPVTLDTVTVKCMLANSYAAAVANGGGFVWFRGPIRFQGAGAINAGIVMSGLAFWGDSGRIPAHTLVVTNMAFNAGFFYMYDLTVANVVNSITHSGCSGPEYVIAGNSIIRKNGADLPGVGGTVSTGSMVLP